MAKTPPHTPQPAALPQRSPQVTPQVTPHAFRQILSQFPTGVAVVTAQHGDHPIGMTANSFSSVSLSPPLVLWSVAKAALSHDAFVAADSFAIHFLGADHHDLARRFAGRGGAKFDGIAQEAGITGAPLLSDLAPILECRHWARYPGGDHTILVGEVVRVVARSHDPLLFHSGELRRFDASRTLRNLPQPSSGSFASTYLAYLLARASFLVSGEFHAALPQWHLSVAEWRVLACLMDAEGLAVGELAAMALMKQPGLTKLLDRMEAEGLVTRSSTSDDRRRVLIHLTKPGRARVAPVLLAAKTHETELLNSFTADERATIKAALHLLIDRHTA